MAYPQKPEQLLPRQPASILSPQVAGFEVHDPSHCWNCGRLTDYGQSFILPFLRRSATPRDVKPWTVFLDLRSSSPVLHFAFDPACTTAGSAE
eukprot:s3510_g13.t1